MFLKATIYNEIDNIKRKFLIPIKNIDNIFEFIEDDNIADIVKSIIRLTDGTTLYCCDTIDELDKVLNWERGKV